MSINASKNAARYSFENHETIIKDYAITNIVNLLLRVLILSSEI